MRVAPPLYSHPLFTRLVSSGLLFAAALAVRLPNLMLIPTYIDEGGEVEWALAIAQGKALPLTSQVSYIGPFYAYLLAILLRIFGASVLLPRLTVAILGACLVVVVYWLGLRLWNRLAGLVAAGLTLLSPVLVIEASHYAWSNSLTPLFVALTLLTLVVGVQTGHARWLALTGLLAALALQTHPISAAALAGMALWLVYHTTIARGVRHRREAGGLRWQPAVLGAVSLFTLGYAPMLVSIVRQARSIAATVTNASYAFSLAASPGEYGTRLVETVTTVAQLVAGGYLPASVMTWVTLALVGGLVGSGLWVGARRTHGQLLAGVLLTSVVLYPMFVKVTWARYLAFVVPFVALAVGIGSAELWRLGIRRRAIYSLAALALMAPLALAGHAGWTITQYYQVMTERGVTNAEHFRLRDELRRQGACGPQLTIARIQPDFTNTAVSRVWFGQMGIDLVLTLDGCEHAMAWPPEVAPRLAAAGPTAWLLTHEAAVQAVAGYTQVESVGSFRLGVIDAQASPLTLYRLTRSGQ